MMGTTRDYYEILGVSRDADEGQLKKAFRKLARELHPDVNTEDPHAEEKFKEAAEAYEVLSDAEKRATYDRYGHDGLKSGGYQPNFGDFGSLSDIFSAFFGEGVFGGGGGGPRQGGDIGTQVEIDLAEVASGVSIDIKYEALARCEHCHGNGAEPGTPIETCERCGGAGRLRAVSNSLFGQVMREVACDVCRGEGKVAQTPCGVCKGEGAQLNERELSVDIPAGIAHGQRVRLAGHGHAGDAGAPPGDLYVLVIVREHESLVRDDNDLITVLDVFSPVAAIGGEFTVQGLVEEVSVKVSAGAQPGDVITLAGKGLPALRGGRKGALKVVLNVVTPRNLSEEQAKLLADVAEGLSEKNAHKSGDGVWAKLKRLLHSD